MVTGELHRGESSAAIIWAGISTDFLRRLAPPTSRRNGNIASQRYHLAVQLSSDGQIRLFCDGSLLVLIDPYGCSVSLSTSDRYGCWPTVLVVMLLSVVSTLFPTVTAADRPLRLLFCIGSLRLLTDHCTIVLLSTFQLCGW